MMIRIIAAHSFRTLRLQFALAAAVGGFLMGCSHPPLNQLQGYIEGEFIYVASPLAGALEKLPVQRGAQVKAGDPLFELESRSEKAALDEAVRRLAQAKASLEDAKKGKRTSEVASIEAQVQQARIALELSEKDLVRQDHLLQITGATTQQDIDRIRSTRDQDRQ
ncbi:MAG: Multidrug resistance efflux pump, partial [Verrucomicrobiales bacterium]|nr:Multidrug resistance efflux pump [Verrucomicrobiales bacterium]